MTHQLGTDDFEQILFDQFGASREQLLERLDQRSQVYERTTARWKQFLESAKSDLMMANATPLQVLKQLELVCHYQSMVDDQEHPSLCEQFERWKTDRKSIASLLEHLRVVEEIPPEGLDNFEIEGVLDTMQRTFGGIQLFRVQTRDFMFCDVQKRFKDPEYPSQEQMRDIKDSLHTVNENGLFRELQKGLLQGGAFGKLTGPRLSAMHAEGVDFVGIVLNTASCDSGGVHWVAFCIDHVSRTIEIFDSTGEYRQELQPAIGFARFLVLECTSVFDEQYTLVIQDQPVQEDSNTCGVFSLFYIYARILGCTPERIKRALSTRQGNNYIRMFKQMLFA